MSPSELTSLSVTISLAAFVLLGYSIIIAVLGPFEVTMIIAEVDALIEEKSGDESSGRNWSAFGALGSSVVVSGAIALMHWLNFESLPALYLACAFAQIPIAIVCFRASIIWPTSLFERQF